MHTPQLLGIAENQSSPWEIFFSAHEKGRKGLHTLPFLLKGLQAGNEVGMVSWALWPWVAPASFGTALCWSGHDPCKLLQ